HWQIRQPFDGIYIWRDPYGAYYLVDHTGTRKTNPPPRRARPRRTPPGTRPKPLVVAISYTDTIVEYDADAA
ncbi:MAG: DUF222 domain-containing protein, partial [Nocardioides sp.]